MYNSTNISRPSSRPIAAPRSKNLESEEIKGFDNDGFSSDHDEVLRIETIDDQSPTIKMGAANQSKIENGASTLSEEEEETPMNFRKNNMEHTDVSKNIHHILSKENLKFDLKRLKKYMHVRFKSINSQLLIVQKTLL